MVYFIIEVLNDTQAVIKSRDKKTNVYYLSEFFNYTKTTFKTSYDTAYNTLVEKLIDMGVDVYGTGGGSSNLVIYDENGNALPVKEKLQFTGSTSVTEITDRIIVNVTGGGGSGGLQKVIHDNTLSGDGTNANPLSVIGGGGSSGHTIVDKDGNVMPTRENLIFEGNNTIVDDPSGNATIVTITGGGGGGSDASEIAYHNPELPTVEDALDKSLDDLANLDDNIVPKEHFSYTITTTGTPIDLDTLLSTTDIVAVVESVLVFTNNNSEEIVITIVTEGITEQTITLQPNETQEYEYGFRRNRIINVPANCIIKYEGIGNIPVGA